MPRKARVVVEGLPHHIVQRGNDRRITYETDMDRRVRLQLLEEFSQKHGLNILGFCLMTNHDHFLAVPERLDSIASTLRMMNAAYARYFNGRRQGCGHVWQERAYSHPVDEAACWAVLAYIERNPVRAGMVNDASSYPWSSAKFRQPFHFAPLWLNLDTWQQQFTFERWNEVLRTSLNEEAMRKRVRDALRSGFPLGSQVFVENLEAQLGRTLRAQKPGPKSAGSARSGTGVELPVGSAVSTIAIG